MASGSGKTPEQAMANSEREHFEKWARDYMRGSAIQRDGEHYIDQVDDYSWATWQASAKLNRAAGEATGLEKAAQAAKTFPYSLTRDEIMAAIRALKESGTQ